MCWYKDSRVIYYCHREGSQRGTSELYWVCVQRQSSNILLSQEGKSEMEVRAAAGV